MNTRNLNGYVTQAQACQLLGLSRGAINIRIARNAAIDTLLISNGKGMKPLRMISEKWIDDEIEKRAR